MAILPLSAATSSIAGTPASSKVGSGAESFGKVLKAQTAPKPQENSPIPVAQNSTEVKAQGVTANAGKCRVDAAEAASSAKPIEAAAQGGQAAKVLDHVSAAQSKMDQILKIAESGKSFSPAELLSLQAHVYRASQELDLAGKVIEKATGGVKQVLQTQV